MKIWVALVPFAAFIAAFFFGALALWLVARRTKISHTETAAGKALHVESPVGTLDMRPEAKLDARLALIPVYPGARPENPAAAESVTELHIGSRILKDIRRATGLHRALSRCGTSTGNNCPTGRKISTILAAGRNSSVTRQITYCCFGFRDAATERLLIPPSSRRGIRIYSNANSFSGRDDSGRRKLFLYGSSPLNNFSNCAAGTRTPT
jgi:hypothetical protein